MTEDDGRALKRARLMRLLGNPAPTSFTVAHRQTRDSKGCIRVEQLSLISDRGEAISGFLTGPPGCWENVPAVLYCHAHGNRYDIGASELIEGRPALLAEAYGPALARRGVVALCIDMPCFGSRAQETESAMAKRLLWNGKTLFGLMLADLAGAHRLLAALDGINASRISVFGFSMGATHAFWLGALEPPIARVAHACCFADLATLIEAGTHDLHGPYMTVPGLVRHFRTGEIAGLCAPRPQLAIMGARDALTPADAMARASADLRQAYRHCTERLRIQIDPNVSHVETPAMRSAVLDFLSDSS